MRTESFTLPSFAKINLYLSVIGKRPDGYHDLCTIFQTVSLHDSLTFSEFDQLVLTCDDPHISTGPDNLINRAAAALVRRFGVRKGARIHLEKRIPSPGGLGGGSSNAAVALLGLVKLWKLRRDDRILYEISCGLGADVPFFLTGGTALGTGRGTEITPLDNFRSEHILILTPGISVSTADAFAGLDVTGLTSAASKRILKICRFEAEAAVFRLGELRNDFENTVLAIYPEIARAKQVLFDLGARQASLSGSGASVFGIFDKEETRQAAIKALDKEVNWRKFAVAAISREQYRENLYNDL